MILSLWSLIPWCGVQPGPPEPDALLSQGDRTFREGGDLRSGLESIGRQINVAQRSIDPRIERIGAPRRSRGDFQS
jgi:hypothetical protein